MKGKQVIIIADVPRIDRYIYNVVWPDGTQEHFTTRLAAYRYLVSKMPREDRRQLVSYSQVARMIAQDTHYTFATPSRKVYQIRASEVLR